MSDRQSKVNTPPELRPEFDPGPWWWRLRCRVSGAVLRVGAWLEPSDLGSTSWYEDGYVVIAQVRRHEELPR